MIGAKRYVAHRQAHREPTQDGGHDRRGGGTGHPRAAHRVVRPSLSMFLCKRVRSEVGVDSVGVGGGELGQGLLPVGGDLSLDESALGPARVGGRVLLLGALRGPAVLDVADRQPQQFDRRLVGGEVAAVLGGPRGSVVQRLDRVGGADDPAQGRGEGQEGDEPLPGPLPRRRRLGVLAARVGLAEGVQGPSGGLLVGGGAGSGAGRRRPPCGPRRRRTARVARIRWTTQVGTMESGQDRPGRPRAGRSARRSTRSARP